VVLFGRLFMLFGVFLILLGGGYGLASADYEGLALALTVAGGALLVGAYAAAAVRRARTGLAAGAPEPAGGEPHVAPTIWPLVFAVAMVGLVVGAVGSPWALLAGGALGVVAGVGWALDVIRQGRHPTEEHPDTAAGHG
jgi:hypothetical protein